jgi:hypothetical protein
MVTNIDAARTSVAPIPTIASLRGFFVIASLRVLNRVEPPYGHRSRMPQVRQSERGKHEDDSYVCHQPLQKMVPEE